MVWDYTCPDTLAPSHLTLSSATGRAAADVAERNKRVKYTPLTPHYIMVPIAIETLGAYGAEAWDFIGSLGARLARVTGDRRAVAFLRQRLSVAIQKANAVAVRGTRRDMLPPPQPGDV